METHVSILAWRIPMDRGTWWATGHGTQPKKTKNSHMWLMTTIWHAEAVLSHSVCPTLCNLEDCSPLGSSVHRDSPGKKSGVGCHGLLQGIFPTQGLNPHLLHWQADSLPMSHQQSPNHIIMEVFI